MKKNVTHHSGMRSCCNNRRSAEIPFGRKAVAGTSGGTDTPVDSVIGKRHRVLQGGTQRVYRSRWRSAARLSGMQHSGTAVRQTEV